MAENPKSSVYVGNLDERVSERVLYDILIQAGRVLELYIPRDKETARPKGYAFAQYESEEIAEYAVKLFTGLVTLYNRTLKFAISGQDKPSANLSIATPPAVNSSPKPRSYPEPYNNVKFSPQSARLPTLCRFSEHQINNAEGIASPRNLGGDGVGHSTEQGYPSHCHPYLLPSPLSLVSTSFSPIASSHFSTSSRIYVDQPAGNCFIRTL